MDKLLSLPAKELLRKFGSGNHKPGSGSATALQALLSAALNTDSDRSDQAEETATCKITGLKRKL